MVDEFLDEKDTIENSDINEMIDFSIKYITSRKTPNRYNHLTL